MKKLSMVTIATKKDIEELEVRIEKGFRQLIIVIISLMIALSALEIVIIKLF